MKKEQLLQYINDLVVNHITAAYYSDAEQYIYFYHKSLTYTICSTSSSISLSIAEESSKITETINLSLNEIKPILDNIINLNHIYLNDPDVFNLTNKNGEKVLNKYIKNIDEFLTTYDPESDIDKFASSNEYIYKFKISIPMEVKNIIKIGEIVNRNTNKSHLPENPILSKNTLLLTSTLKSLLTTYPLTLYLSNQSTISSLVFNILISSFLLHS